nr:copper chaperone PCu(A)C [uncultured Limnohabitans sp.]
MQMMMFKIWQSARKSGFGLGFMWGGLFMGWVALTLLGAGTAQAHDFRHGELVIDHPYATPSLAGTTTGAVYFKAIRNQGQTPDRLLSARTAVATRVEIHQMQMDGKVMRMRQVPALELPAQTEVSLRHGGAGTHHLMLLDMAKPLKDGDRFDLELVFEKAGTRRVNVWVQTPRAGAPAHAH